MLSHNAGEMSVFVKLVFSLFILGIHVAIVRRGQIFVVPAYTTPIIAHFRFRSRGLVFIHRLGVSVLRIISGAYKQNKQTFG